MVKSILACFAHPDDEAGLGPLIAHYVAQGAQATLICTTNGDVGTVDEKNADIDLVAAYEAINPVTTKVMTRKYLEAGWAAIACYSSQMEVPPLIRRLRGIIGPLFLSKTSLCLVMPAHQGAGIERDLFEGVID